MDDEILNVYDKEIDIQKIISGFDKFSFDDLIKTRHFYYSINEKKTDINFLRDNFRNFEKIKIIAKRKHKNGRISHDFYYEIENNIYLVYSLALENIPVLLNGFKVNRNFKDFKKKLIKSYRDKIIG